MTGECTFQRWYKLLDRTADECTWRRGFSGNPDREEGSFCPLGPGCIEGHAVRITLKPVVAVEPDYVSGFWRFTLKMPRTQQ